MPKQNLWKINRVENLIKVLKDSKGQHILLGLVLETTPEKQQKLIQ